MTLFFRAFMFTCAVLVYSGQAQGQPTWHAGHDSASYYLMRGKLKYAERLATQNLERAKTPSEKARSYLLIGSILEERGYIHPAREAFLKCKTVVLPGGQNHIFTTAINAIASIETTMGRYDSISYFLNWSRKLDTTTQNLIQTQIVEGKYLQTQNQYDEALTIFQQALDKALLLNDRKNIAIILSNIGSIHFSHNPDIKLAIDFYQRSVTYCDSLLHASILARNYCRIANAYMVKPDLIAAESYLKRARKISDLSDNLAIRAYILSSWTILLAEQGHILEAAEFSAHPIRIKRELGQFRQLQSDLLNTSEMYMMVKEYGKAKKMLDEGTAISHSLHDIVFLKYFYNRHAMLDTLTGNYKAAYFDLKRSMAYEDSTFSLEHLRAVNEVKEKYEAEQKEKVIAEKELEIEQQKYQQALLIGASGAAVLILMFILIVVRNTNKIKLQRLKEHQHLLRLKTIVETQEAVQQRVARDLHDGLVQVLGAAKMSLQSAGPQSDNATLQKYIRTASDIMDEAVTEARSISHQILPYSLLKGGLIEALEELFERSLKSYQFNKSATDLPIQESEAINIYRIVQELVNNVQKHSDATDVIIHFVVTTTAIRLVFKDNGKGFNLSAKSSGAGISNLMTRAELMKGTLVFRSDKTGTHVELTIPR